MRRQLSKDKGHFFLGKSKQIAPILLKQAQSAVINFRFAGIAFSLVPDGSGHIIALQRTDLLVVESRLPICLRRPPVFVAVFVIIVQELFIDLIAVDRLTGNPRFDHGTAGSGMQDADRHIQRVLHLHSKGIAYRR